MGRVLLVYRLVVRDVCRRPAEAALLLLSIAAATTTLTLGLALNDVVSKPYQQTRAATAGPDVVAMPRDVGPAAVADLAPLLHAPGVVGHSGPYPLVFPMLEAHGDRVQAVAEGRDTAPAPIDQPELTQGGWVRPGGVVVERGFADALGIHPGDQIRADGRAFEVVGIAVTAADGSYPFAEAEAAPGGGPVSFAGLVWLTQADTRSLASSSDLLWYTLNLRLADPARAEAFVRSSSVQANLRTWQDIARQDGRVVAWAQEVMLIGSWLLGALAIATVAVLVAGRMVEQTRRVGLLKAVGGTPGLIAAVLLAEHLALALLAAGVGLTAGWLVAPLLSGPGAGLVGTAGAPPPALSTVKWVAALALAVAVAATLGPALRAARTSTVRALADAAHAPRRRAGLIALSAWLPAPLLLGLRLTARRPRRAFLSAVSVAVTATTIAAVLTYQAQNRGLYLGSSTLPDPRDGRANQAMLILTVVLVALAVINTIVTTWTMALDARRPLAIARTLGATPQQVTAGLAAAQLLPALPGASIGIPAGIGLCAVASHGPLTIPPAWWLLAAGVATLFAVAGLTAIPARIGARRPVAEILQSENA